MRSRISVAAASVKVTIRISSIETGGFSLTRHWTHRSTSVLVLPDPAPAITSTLPRAEIARVWESVKVMAGLRERGRSLARSIVFALDAVKSFNVRIAFNIAATQ